MIRIRIRIGIETMTIQYTDFQGQYHEIFCFWFFSWISFPPAPKYSIKTVSIFFENSRRYSQLKVCYRCRWHRWQMEKIFNLKNCNNFVWSPLGSRGKIYINFCLQVHLQVSAAWYCSHCRRCRWCRWQFATGVVDIGGKFAAGIADTGGAPWLANISANFRKNSKWF